MRICWLTVALTVSSACLVPVEQSRGSLATDEAPPTDAGEVVGATSIDAGSGPIHTLFSECFPAGSTHLIHQDPQHYSSMLLDGAGKLALWSYSGPPWNPIKRVIDFDGTVLSTVVLENTHENIGLGAVANDGRGLTVIFGGNIGNQQLEVTYVRDGWTKEFRPAHNASDWTSHDLAFNPARDEFALFWGSEGRIAMQTRFTDGGVGNTSIVATDFLGKPAAIAWTPDRYVVLGISTAYSVSADGTLNGQLELPGTGRTVATDLGNRAGVTVHGFDGGSLAFTELSGTQGPMTARTYQLLDHVMESAADALWDPVAGAWRVVFAPRQAGPLSLATITPTGSITVTPLGCSVVADEVRLVLSGRSLFVMSYTWAVPSSSVLRVDL